jgi:arabinose-5-phosphate isomerase
MSGSIVSSGRRVFEMEIDALERTKNVIGDEFVSICDEINHCSGKVVFVGMGKPGRVNGKVAATFSSLGIPSFVLHPGEAMHGDLGVLQKNDLVIAVSYSGESDEVVSILPLLRRFSSKLIAVTGRGDSRLSKAADIVQVLPQFAEADPLGLAPTSSTTVWIAYADALAVAVSSMRGFTSEDFGGRHPAGSLGKKLLLKVDDIMRIGDRNATVLEGSPLTAAIAEIGKKCLGITSVVNEEGSLVGVITDGDLRRQLERGEDIYALSVDEIMSRQPAVAYVGSPVVDALALMRQRNVSCLPVLDGTVPVGIVQMQAIVDAGVVI